MVSEQLVLGPVSIQEHREEEEEESRPVQRRSPGDASVNARAMSRRKQGNPQHLSQREITRKYTCNRKKKKYVYVSSLHYLSSLFALLRTAACFSLITHTGIV